MDLSKLAEPFPADDIEWRVQSSGLSGGKPWARVLAYVTARAIMSRLDAVCGAGNWRPRYTHEGGGVMCHLSIRVEREGDTEIYWIEKSDGAEQTDIEKFKGGLSSALKRAGSVWGIGRYLYKLEAGFAECTTKKDPAYPHWAKTKDGTSFFWKPPALPTWALPGGSKESEPEPREPVGPPHNLGGPALERDAVAAKSRKGPKVTAPQTKRIHALKRDLNLEDKTYRTEMFRSYHCRTSKDLTRDQAGELIDRMDKKLQSNVGHDVAETFGEGGRAVQLRTSALGFCDRVEQLGAEHIDGSPIDYQEAGLVVGTLEELREVLEAMVDEKELELMVVRLEALLERMTF